MIINCRECGHGLSHRIQGPCVNCGEPEPFKCCICGRFLNGPLTNDVTTQPTHRITSKGPVCASTSCMEKFIILQLSKR